MNPTAPLERRITLSSEAETAAFATQLAQLLPSRCVVALNGTLGAGKTRFVQAFAEACGVPAGEVTSPTFTLWQTYRGSRQIHHLDAYRIADEDEFDALGVEECWSADATTFIEWADRVKGSLPPEHLTLRLDVLSDDSRRVVLQTIDPQLADVLAAVKDPGTCDN